MNLLQMHVDKNVFLSLFQKQRYNYLLALIASFMLIWQKLESPEEKKWALFEKISS